MRSLAILTLVENTLSTPSNQSSILLLKESRFTKDQPQQQQQGPQRVELNIFSHQSF